MAALLPSAVKHHQELDAAADFVVAAVKSVALLTVEGEHDDISGVGQTRAAHDILTNIPADRRAHYLQPKVGHYGVFNGSRFRAEIAPRIADFIASHARPLANGAGYRNGSSNGHGAMPNGSATPDKPIAVAAAAKPAAKARTTRKPRAKRKS